MNREAVLHLNTEEYVYPISRNVLIFKIRTAKQEIRQCQLVYWKRTDISEKREQKMEWYARDQCFDYFQVRIEFSQIARYQKYYFKLLDAKGKEFYYSVHGISCEMPKSGYFEYLYVNQWDVINVPKWAEGAVFYQIFPERFCNGDRQNDPKECQKWGTMPTRENYMGGDLRGIIRKIPYLQALGVECIYLNPIFEGDFNHKYATTDYYRVDPQFGTKEELREMVDTCHAHGIRILLDGVFNHTGIHFEPFQNMLLEQENSAYKDWFLVTQYPVTISHHNYECVGAYKWMPKLNSANEEVRRFIIEVMEYWISEIGIDGWRLDVADEVDATVWQEARLMLKEKYPDCFLMGETWGYGGKLLRGNEMDSVMNYLFRDTVRDYFAEEIITTVEFDFRINNMLALYKEETCRVMYNLLDSHDTERFLYLCKEDKRKLKLAVAFQFLFIGAPAIYYGDEVGISGDNDPDCRRCMIWGEDQDQNLYDWYCRLIRLRKEKKSIRRGHYRSILADDKKRVYAFVRYLEEETVYIILHSGSSNTVVECPVLEKEYYEELLDEQDCESRRIEEGKLFFNGDMMEYQAYLNIEMEPYSVKVISKKKEEKGNEKR